MTKIEIKNVDFNVTKKKNRDSNKQVVIQVVRFYFSIVRRRWQTSRLKEHVFLFYLTKLFTCKILLQITKNPILLHGSAP